MTTVSRNITGEPLGKSEARLLAKMGSWILFLTNDAREAREHRTEEPTSEFLGRLQKGWIRRIRQGRFAIIPLSSREEGSQLLRDDGDG